MHTVWTRQWIDDILNLFYPKICQACGITLVRQENVLCLSCLMNLPRTGFTMNEENPVTRAFWGRVKVEFATSFLFFNKGGHVQELIHGLKYKQQKEIGFYLGSLFGKELKSSPFFKETDLLVPVPLHPKKLQQRGFNQSRIIALGMLESIDTAIDDTNLKRVVFTSSQTRKSRYERWENVRDAFKVENESEFEGKHVLLVDDVLTTGATLEACASVILSIKNTRVSVATLAYAQV